jgi:hypothetical protein
VVLSSGLAGVFPKGMLLGVVTGVSRKEGGLFQKIDVAPAVDFGKLEEVYAVITETGTSNDLLPAPPALQGWWLSDHHPGLPTQMDRHGDLIVSSTGSISMLSGEASSPSCSVSFWIA